MKINNVTEKNILAHRWKLTTKLRQKIFLTVIAALMTFSVFVIFVCMQNSSRAVLEYHQQSVELRKFKPAYSLSKGRTDVLLGIGIPTVFRDHKTYLFTTLESLISNMNTAEEKEALIVVFIAETNMNYVLTIASEIQVRFRQYCENGIIEIISPPSSYYPDFENLKITLDDSKERVKWRSKQNLDNVFLMEYTRNKAKYFLQLEDDVITKPGYVTIVREFIEECNGRDPWYILDFCQLGAIGKLFHLSDLPDMIAFLKIFFNDKPVDWLLDYFLMTKFCHYDDNQEACSKKKEKIRLRKSPSTFQHIGKYSSLKGKIQQWTDGDFN